MNKKLILSEIFPSLDQSLRVMQSHAPRFYRCPGGHSLPHRGVQGRCSPLDCVVDQSEHGMQVITSDSGNNTPHTYRREMDMMPRGVEHEVLDHHLDSAQESEMVRAQSEEALALMRTVGIKAAREALMAHPEVPNLPSQDQFPTVEEWSKAAIKGLVPFAIAVKKFRLLFGNPAQQDATADEILDRSGVAPRKQEQARDFSGPVLILNLGPTTPYDQQKVVNGQRGSVTINAGNRNSNDDGGGSA